MPEGTEQQAGNPASSFALALLDRLIANGVRFAVVAPGSRSQALALAAAELERQGKLTLAVRVDERAAGFTALGLALESGTAVPIIVTSGTAVANLHPAMLEAWHSGVPLIALTADRPDELRGVGANQATVQPGIFGPAATWSIDVPAPQTLSDSTLALSLADEIWRRAAPGTPDSAPVHVNVALRDPLSGNAAPVPHARDVMVQERTAPAALPLPDPFRAIVVAGAGAGLEAEQFARAAGLPLVAEVASGARFGPQLVPAYRRLLADPDFGGSVRTVVVYGRPNLSREVSRLLTKDGVDTILVRAPGAQQFDPARRARIVDAIAPSSEPGDPAWVRAWILAGRQAAAGDEDIPYRGGGAAESNLASGRLAREELAALRAPVTRRFLVEAVWRASWPHDRLLLGASRLIREADDVVPGKRIRVHANRGLAGIDGTVSTALGIALATALEPKSAAGTTRVLLGDLTLLHDAGGLLLPVGDRRPRVQLIVGNDRGGTIFDGLEVAGSTEEALFERVVLTPQDVDIVALAAAYGWQHALVETRGDLDRALTSPPAGPSILEVPLPR